VNGIWYDENNIEITETEARKRLMDGEMVFSDVPIDRYTGICEPAENTCPICHDKFIPSITHDVCVPGCGCYGSFHPERIDMPCDRCGNDHLEKCEKVIQSLESFRTSNDHI